MGFFAKDSGGGGGGGGNTFWGLIFQINLNK